MLVKGIVTVEAVRAFPLEQVLMSTAPVERAMETQVFVPAWRFVEHA